MSRLPPPTRRRMGQEPARSNTADGRGRDAMLNGGSIRHTGEQPRLGVQLDWDLSKHVPEDRAASKDDASTTATGASSRAI